MKKLKRIISLIMVLVMLSSLLTACSGCKTFSFEEETTAGKHAENNDENVDGNRVVTRGEWAIALGQQFGLDACQSLTPYFSDVDSTTPYFVYVQAGVEWQIYTSEGGEFRPDDEATKEFILETSMRAAEVIEMNEPVDEFVDTETPDDGSESPDSNEFQVTQMKEITKDELVELVADSSLNDVSASELSDEATADYATQVLMWAVDEYQNQPFEEYNNVVVREDVVSMPDTAVNSDGSFTVSETDLEVGDIIITAPEGDNIAGVARKVTAVTKDANGNVLIETTQPEIGEVFEDIEFAQVATVQSADDITAEEGFSVTITEGDEITALRDVKYDACSIDTLGSKKTTNICIDATYSSKTSLKTTSKSTIDIGKSKIEGFDNLSDEDKEALNKTGVAGIDEPAKGVNKIQLTTTGKYEEGYEIKGSIELKNFYVETSYETKKFANIPYGIKSLDCKINYDVIANLSIEGTIDGEIKVATTDILIGTTGATLTVDVFLKSSLNGKFEIESRISNITSVNYTSGSGFKKSQKTTDEKTINLSGSASFSVAGTVTLKLVGISLIDVGVEVGGGMDVSGTIARVMQDDEGKLYIYEDEYIDSGDCTVKNLICFDGEAYIPTLTVKVGYSSKTLANKLGLKFAWKVFDRSGGVFKCAEEQFHYEVGKGWCLECTYDDLEMYKPEDETTTESETTFEEESTTSGDSILGNGMLTISNYAVWLDVGNTQNISVVSLPKGYSDSDIVWSIDDSTIASISSTSGSSNNVTAVGSGVAYITVSTSDGTYSCSCAVTVNSDGGVSFDPL